MKSPMLAYNSEWEWADIPKWPVGVTVKQDGIRAITTPSGPLTRTGKPIFNRYVRAYLSQLPPGLDGEVVTLNPLGGNDDFHIASGKLRSSDDAPAFRYYVFDYIMPNTKYIDRMYKLNEVLPMPHLFCHVLQPVLMSSPEAVEECFRIEVERGSEGLIIRDLDAPYKHGRATLNEASMFKLVPWREEVGTIVGFTPNAFHPDRIGSIIVRHPEYGEVKLGTGFSLETSRKLKQFPFQTMGTKVVFKHKHKRKVRKLSSATFVEFQIEHELANQSSA